MIARKHKTMLGLNSRKIIISLILCFVLFCLLVEIKSLNAMMLDVSLEKLVETSDVIAIVDVIAVKKVGTLPSGCLLFANLVKINQPFMGDAAVGERLKIKTRIFEDNAYFKSGKQYLLFLKKVKNYYEVNYGIAGSWPINAKGELIGYGTGKKISEVEKTIEKVKDMKVDPKAEKSSKSKVVISL